MGRYVESLPTPLQVIALALIDWWDDWINMLIINLLWWLCWLTIILGPPATFGLYYVTNQLAYGKSVGVKGFISGTRQSFLKSWQWMLVNLAVAVIITVNIFFYQEQSANWAQILRILFIILAVFWIVIQSYTVPYLMEQEDKSIRIAYRNALFTILAAPGFTLVITVVAGVIVVLSVRLIAPLFLGIPCLLACIGNRAIAERIETYGLRPRENEDNTHYKEEMEE
ncbi:MAG: DUF624 domain-containing protein [Chloroflexota bacterium]|nr:MAG: DUF624 domain-containing protein [Chloroflexota bacterium]